MNAGTSRFGDSVTPKAVLGVIVVIVFGACGAPSRDMSHAHRELSEAGSCGHCHADAEGRQATTAQKCLQCHTELAKRIVQRRGLHAFPIAAAATRTSAPAGGRECPDRTRKEHDFHQRCGTCHREHAGTILATWAALDRCDQPEQFRAQHTKVTGFALLGGHAKAACISCHTKTANNSQTFLGAGTTCAACHNNKQKPHGALRPPLLRCDRCHDESSWKPRQDAAFDHQRDTQFPLTGDHAVLPCTSRCHQDWNNRSRGVPQFWLGVDRRGDCVPCHERKAKQHGGAFGTAPCRTCHSTNNGWAALPFDHEANTGMPLVGAHKLPCASCHQATAQRPPSKNCGTCHGTRQVHGQRFSKLGDCAICHRGASWNEVGFNHAKYTRFPLAEDHGVDDLKECRKCHTGRGPAEFSDLSKLVASRSIIDCKGCHEHHNVHASDDRGKSSQLCSACHQAGKRTIKSCQRPGGVVDRACLNRQLRFGHSPERPFQLIGGHALTKMKDGCTTCHKAAAQQLGKIPTACISCHRNDPHKGSLGADCQRCHDYRPGRWQSVVGLDHTRVFPLVGPHKLLRCASCHNAADPTIRYTGVPRQCSSCHGKDDIHQPKRPECRGACCHNPVDPVWSFARSRLRKLCPGG